MTPVDSSNQPANQHQISPSPTMKISTHRSSIKAFQIIRYRISSMTTSKSGGGSDRAIWVRIEFDGGSSFGEKDRSESEEQWGQKDDEQSADVEITRWT